MRRPSRASKTKKATSHTKGDDSIPPEPFNPSIRRRLLCAEDRKTRAREGGWSEAGDLPRRSASLLLFLSGQESPRGPVTPPPPPLKPPPRSAPRFPWRGQPWRALPEKRGLGSKALINEQENQILPFLIREERGPNQWKRRLLDADHRRHRRHYKAACSYFFSHFYATEMTKSVIGPAFFTPCSNIIRAITAHLPIIPFLVAEKKNLPKNRNWRSHI